MSNSTHKNTKEAVEIAVRLSLLVIIMYWCFEILSPFFMPVLWGIIIAVAIYPLYHYIQKKIGERKILASAIVTALMLAIIFIPAGFFFSAIIDNIINLKTQYETNNLKISEPAPVIATWPLIGKPLFNFLSHFSEDAQIIFSKYQSQILSAAKVIFNSIVGTGLTFFQIIFAVIIAGILLATKGTAQAADKIFARVLGNKGNDYMQLIVSTVRNVIKGVLGVAVIQAALAGLGLVLAGVPHAGIWALLCLIFAIIQIGPSIITIPCIIYLFITQSTVSASLWAVYFVLVMFSDNILKPLFLSKGSQVPTLVIFLGVLGGFMMQGFIGLFTGAIVLSIGYKLLVAWLQETT
jgi:predicted PurR-regulated permease PerM